ncbi:hypothetical protein EVAR_85415_1 [Eumeta japonica]|uniref:Uncharacterized protein n=1 Tax=Eumeta variegata TaxID=151549 RepID=A0A4C1WM65_EUMVA|nr:hypothetical protein EVAR_85415_1 [Eumeta japonica]
MRSYGGGEVPSGGERRAAHTRVTEGFLFESCANAPPPARYIALISMPAARRRDARAERVNLIYERAFNNARCRRQTSDRRPRMDFYSGRRCNFRSSRFPIPNTKYYATESQIVL